MHKISPIPAFNDNYIWLISRPDCALVAIVDPGDADPVIQYLESKHLNLSAILLTHHHADHSGGIQRLLEYKNVPVWGPKCEKILHATCPLEGGETITLPELNFRAQVLAIPGHTLGHIAFYGEGLLFCGDTLFAGGCGRIFEGTPAQMFRSLKTLAELDSKTQIYCGHEYTEANLRFASIVEPENLDLQKRIEMVRIQRAAGECTLPSSIELELLTNVFLRCHFSSVQAAVSEYLGRVIADPIEVFTELRAWKNSF